MRSFLLFAITHLQLILNINSLKFHSRLNTMSPNVLRFHIAGSSLQSSLSEKDMSFIAITPVLVCGAMLLLPSEAAQADVSSFGVLSGRTAAMVHPISNMALFATSLYSAYIGYQWRRLRGIGEELKDLNSQLPSISSGKLKSPIASTLSALVSELQTLKVNPSAENLDKIAGITSDIGIVNQAAELDSQIAELSSTRKDLLSLNLRDRHFATGSVLLGFGVAVSFLGALNTFIREGQIFPDSHLFAGMGITILWAVAASLVPAMQKGNNIARTAHIALNVLNLLLFAWQIPTGLDIMFQTWDATSWP